MDLGHPPLERAVILEPPGVLFQTGRSYRHKVNQKVKETRTRKERTTIAIKGPRKGRTRVNFGGTFSFFKLLAEAKSPMKNL